jgi:subtilisin-like proprotein convertase family protein
MLVAVERPMRPSGSGRESRQRRTRKPWAAALIVAAAALAHAAPSAAATQEIPLLDGWNLIALSVVPADPNPAAVLAPLIGTGVFESIWAYDAGAAAGEEWTSFTNDAIPPAQPLTTLGPGKGYWLKVTQDASLTVVAAVGSAASAAVNFESGWNLVGFPLEEPRSYERIFLGVSQLRQIWGFDSETPEFVGVVIPIPDEDPTREDFTELEPGHGYWVFASAPFSVEPILATALPGDTDFDPPIAGTGSASCEFNFIPVSPGDVDIGLDGCWDRPESQRAVDFGASRETVTMQVSNAGTGLLSFTVSVDDPSTTPWLRLADAGALVDSITGSVVGETAPIEIDVDRRGLAKGDYTGSLTVVSNGQALPAPDDPTRTIDVFMSVSDIDGEYRVTALLDTVNDQDADLHSPRLRLNIFRDADGLKAIVDASKTLLVPQDVVLTGETVDPGSTRFVLSGSFDVPPGMVGNPYNEKLRREITLIGDRAKTGQFGAPNGLIGEYRETIRFVLGKPIHLAGTFTAERLSTQVAGRPAAVAGSGTALLIPDQTILGDKVGCSTNPMAAQAPGLLCVTLPISDRLVLSEVDISVTLSHTRPADLRISLKSPTGTEVLLRDNDPAALSAGGTTLTFDDLEIPIEPLEDFNGEFSDGNWILAITDEGALQTGILRDAQLSVQGTRVFEIQGTAAAGATILLTGCGISALTTATGGSFSFTNLIECAYQVSVIENDLAPRAIREVVIDANSNAVSMVTLPMATVSPVVPIVDGLPSSSGFRLLSKTTDGGAGLAPPGIAAIDSATFDIDRPPFADPVSGLTVGTEDSNGFTGAFDPVSGTNVVGNNTRLDPPSDLGAPTGVNGRRAVVNIGQPVIGRSSGGGFSIAIGADL